MSSADTILRWWRQGRRRMESTRAYNTATSNTAESPSNRSPRMIQTKKDLKAWVTDLRHGFDAGSGSHFDGRLDGLEIVWHREDDEKHTVYLRGLGQRIAETQRAIAHAEESVQQAEKSQKLAEQNYESARVRLSGEPLSRTHRSTAGAALPSSDPTYLPTLTRAEDTTTRPPTIGNPHQREPHLLPGRSLLDVVIWLFVLLAVAADIVAFYTVLARLFRAMPELIVVGAIGFTAAAIGICHFIGIGLQRRRSADRRRSDGLLWASVPAWLALGALAFFVRLHFGVQDPGALAGTGSSDFGGTSATRTDPNLLAALFFAGLYLVSGLLAITASFYAFNPDAHAYRRASRTLKKAAQQVSNAKAQLAEQRERLKLVEQDQANAPKRRQLVYRETKASVDSLKIEVRHLMAAKLNDPLALDILMKDAPTVTRYPEPGTAS